jgi:hypothetical protein
MSEHPDQKREDEERIKLYIEEQHKLKQKDLEETAKQKKQVIKKEEGEE